jgi:uncharacterized HAD superfamily protein
MDCIGSNGDVHHVKPSEKVKKAQELGVSVMWEDKPTTVTKLAKSGVRVFMPVYPYNAHVEGKNIIRVEGWEG